MIVKYSTGKVNSVYSNDEAEARKESKKEANVKEPETPKKEPEKKEKSGDASK